MRTHAIPLILLLCAAGCSSSDAPIDEPRQAATDPGERFRHKLGEAFSRGRTEGRLVVVLALDGSPEAAEARNFLEGGTLVDAFTGTIGVELSAGSPELRTIRARGIE